MARKYVAGNLFLQTFIIMSLNNVRLVTNFEPQLGCENLHSTSINSDDNYCSDYDEVTKSGN